MTIVAGIECSDGLLLGTDLEITAGLSKRSGGKSTFVSQAGRTVAVAGAGYYDVLAYAAEQLTKGSVGRGMDNIVGQLRNRMKGVYMEHIHPCYDGPERDDALQLLVGIVVPKERRLYSSSRSILRRAGWYAFRGTGVDLAYYLADKWPKDWPSMQDGVGLMRNVILEVSENVAYCGKGTSIIRIGLDGKAEFMGPGS